MTKPKTSSEAVKTAASGETEAGAMSQASATTSRTEPMSLEAALASLDTEDDAHWTADGLPRMEVLESLTNTPLTRDEVEDAAPGFNRTVAGEQHGAGTDSEEPEPATKGAERLPETQSDQEEYIGRLAKLFGWPTLEDLRKSDL